jgi:hypothetical protein
MIDNFHLYRIKSVQAMANPIISIKSANVLNSMLTL